MENKHTPGPWTVNTIDYTNGIGIECNVNGVEHTVVMDQFCYPNFQQHGSEEKLANAKLIAAAPDLLDAVQRCLGLIDELNISEWSEMAFVKSAIEKATK